MLILNPKKGLLEERTKKVKQLSEYKAKLSDEEIKELIKQTEKIKRKTDNSR